MVKFVAIKINYDDRQLPVESKYAVAANLEEHKRYCARFGKDGTGGNGFHECLNFQIREDAPVQAYMPPTCIPKDMEDEYVIFSFTYKNDPAMPSVVLGVQGAATLLSKDGIPRLGVPHIRGVDKLTYYVEAEPDFVSLFSSPLPFDRKNGRYAPTAKWGNGLRYLEPKHAANILNDALLSGTKNLKVGSKSYRAFVEREIEVINRINARYGLKKSASQTIDKLGSATKHGGGGLPDKVLGVRGEELVFRREQKKAVKHGLKQEVVSWASQSNPTLPYDIESVRQTSDGWRPS